MPKLTDYKLLIVFIAIPIILVGLFPSPYFHVWYDVEPDYIANILSIYTNSYPVDYVHPGLTITYLSSFFIHLVGDFDSLDSMIKSLRFLFIYLNLFLIYFALAVLNKSENHHIYLFVIVLLLHPSNYHYFDLLGPNIILGSLGLLIAILGIKLQEKPIIFSFYYGVVLAIGVATKLQFILMIAPLMIAIIFGLLKITEDKLSVFKILILSVSFFFTALILFYPILPIMPFWFTILSGLDIGLKHGLSGLSIGNIIFNFFLLFFIFSILIIFLKKFIWSKKDFKYVDIYTQTSFLIVVLLLLSIVFGYIQSNSYQNLLITQRNTLPFLGFFGLFFSSKYSFFKLTKTKQYVIYLLIIAICMKSYANFINYKNSSSKDLDFSLSIDMLLEEKNEIAFFPISRFISKDYFLLWTDFRYGDRVESFLNNRENIPFAIDDKFDKLNILNYRQFILEDDLDGKFALKYINYMLNNNFTPENYKSLLNNHLEIITKKDPCTEPYNNYTKGDSFSVIIPLGLNYQTNKGTNFYNDRKLFIDEGATSSAKSLADYLKSVWTNQCNFSVDYSTNNFADISVIYLKIKT